jgi:hypothetical protein
MDFKGIKKYILNIENWILQIGCAKGDAVLSGISMTVIVTAKSPPSG